MDERFRAYFEQESGYAPPAMDEQKIIVLLAQRQKRLSIILLSVAGLLWTGLFFAFALLMREINPKAGLMLLSVTCAGLLGAGLSVCLLLEFLRNTNHVFHKNSK